MKITLTRNRQYDGSGKFLVLDYLLSPVTELLATVMRLFNDCSRFKRSLSKVIFIAVIHEQPFSQKIHFVPAYTASFTRPAYARVLARVYMGPCRARVFGHLFRISPRLNGRIYGLKPIRNVCKQVYAAENPRIPCCNFETNGQPYWTRQQFTYGRTYPNGGVTTRRVTSNTTAAND